MSLSITVIIIIINVIISFVAFQDESAFYKLCFWPEKVWHEKEWIRLLSGGFLHANMPHLLFNMISLFFFGPYVEDYFMMEFGGAGHTAYIIFYLMATVVANIPDLNQHKDDHGRGSNWEHDDEQATLHRPVGASVGVCNAALTRCRMLFSRDPQAIGDWRRRGSPLPPPSVVKQRILRDLLPV